MYFSLLAINKDLCQHRVCVSSSYHFSASLTPVTPCLSQPSVRGVKFVNALHSRRQCQIGSETPL